MKRKRERLVTELLPSMPVWVHETLGRTRAHLAIEEGRTGLGPLGIRLACERWRGFQPAQWFDLAHPDDVRCQRCLAWERRYKED